MDSTPPQKKHLALWLTLAAVVGTCIIATIIAIPAAFKQFTHTRTFRVAGNSMAPTLFEGDKITTDTAAYSERGVMDGDIVVFRHNDKLLIKRVSAIGGETIAEKDGKLIRDGVPLTEPYLKNRDNPSDPSDATLSAQTIPEQQIFVTGDWRSISTDSRDPDYGPVYLSDVVGKVVYIYGSSHLGQVGRKF